MFDAAGIWCALIWCLYLIAVTAILVGDLFLVVCCARLVVSDVCASAWLISGLATGFVFGDSVLLRLLVFVV